MYYLAQFPPPGVSEPHIKHSFTLPSLSSLTSEVRTIVDMFLVVNLSNQILYSDYNSQDTKKY